MLVHFWLQQVFCDAQKMKWSELDYKILRRGAGKKSAEMCCAAKSSALFVKSCECGYCVFSSAFFCEGIEKSQEDFIKKLF